uniref:Uncharacterized protein n=1 Tax=Panagrolaimus sp. JU765 TaxID=591449 RepID=A0AC34RSD4_9BILA
MNFLDKIYTIESSFDVLKKECGKTRDAKDFAVIIYEDEDDFKIWGAVAGTTVEHTESCKDLENAECLAQMAANMLRNNSFSHPDFPESAPAPAPVEKSNDATTMYAMNAMMEMVKMMQDSSENHANRLEKIINTTEKGRSDLQNMMALEYDKNRKFVKEIVDQNHEHQMATNQIMANMQRDAIEANTRQQDRFLTYQTEQLAIQNDMQRRIDDERNARDEREAQMRREHEARLEHIRAQQSRRRGGCSIM